MNSRNPIFLLLFAVVFSICCGNVAGQVTGPGPDDLIIRQYTPPAWQADQVVWVRDQNQNKIDDFLDPLFSDSREILVNYRRCVTDDDIGFLTDLSSDITVKARLKYITSVLLSGVNYDVLQVIANLPEVAFIEARYELTMNLDNSIESLAITAGIHSPNTIEEQCPVDGTGVNIVIMDSGVDTNHPAFASTTFVGGFDALTNTFGNPPTNGNHGTHVASIALGQTSTWRGVAPGAGLIDVQMYGIAETATTPAVPALVSTEECLEIIYDQRVNWSVDVINMSFGRNFYGNQQWPIPADGTEALCQLIDLAETMGIVTVAAMGNGFPNNTSCGIGNPTPCISEPAAATRAITVASIDDQNTVDPADDTISGFSSQGPRHSDSDFQWRDELKPDVAAPGSFIEAAEAGTNGTIVYSGTSMAAPHVAGLAALIMEANPGINAASVRDLIISTADPNPAFPPSPQANGTAWNNRYGFGVIDPFEAVCPLSSSADPPPCDADLGFPSAPWSPGWLCPDIYTSSPPQTGSLNTVFVDIENFGPQTANDVNVHFGVHNYSASPTAFYDIGQVVVDIPVGVTTVSIVWVPQAGSHQCMKIEIGYGCDSNFSNNTAQRNLTVGNSPVKFEVRNILTDGPEEIFFDVILDDSTWDYTIEPESVVLAAEDCPAEITIELIPPAGLPPGTENRMHVAAVMAGAAGNVVELGGVTVLQRVPGENCTNGTDDDGDGAVDCEDSDCFGDPDCTSNPPITIGDPNGDGALNIADAIAMLGYLFGGEPLNCVAAMDVNGDNVADISDAIYELSFLFSGGPGPVGGADCTPDSTPPNPPLECESSGCP